MKKVLLIVLILLAIGVIALFCCVGSGIYLTGPGMNGVAEEVLGGQIPEGYKLIFALNSFDKQVLLEDQENHNFFAIIQPFKKRNILKKEDLETGFENDTLMKGFWRGFGEDLTFSDKYTLNYDGRSIPVVQTDFEKESYPMHGELLLIEEQNIVVFIYAPEKFYDRKTVYPLLDLIFSKDEEG